MNPAFLCLALHRPDLNRHFDNAAAACAYASIAGRRERVSFLVVGVNPNEPDV
jgi:hypothetical protein